MDFPDIGLRVPRMVLPRADIDMQKWSVIACDQYTSEPDYWERIGQFTGDQPSTLNLIFPEAYLHERGAESRITNINQCMRRYLEEGVLEEQPPGFVLVDRKTHHAPSRKGLMVALDLERYDFRPGSTSLIRATEGTILDRLPPRIRVREDASLELPHIMVLIDDPGQTVIEPLFDHNLPKLYDFELMEGGGHVKGWRIAEEGLIHQVVDRLRNLADPEDFRSRYQISDEEVMLYAMGDGNHSFATAKAIWEKLKAQAADQASLMQHPARFALVELVNLHDPGLEFEAIHRMLFGVEPEAVLTRMAEFFAASGSQMSWRRLANEQEALALLAEKAGEASHLIPFVEHNGFGVVEVKAPHLQLVVATLQEFLDAFLSDSGAKIDYLHGAEVVTRLGGRPGNMGFYLPAISKFELFRTIILDGALPRKTFSMGEADEKRFYLECRKIVP